MSTPHRAPTLIAAATLAAAALTGCGLTNPYQSTGRATAASSTNSTTTTSTAADALDPRPERGGHIPAAVRAAQDRVSAAAGSSTARDAVIRYATLAINWQAATLAAHERRLAALAIGAARLQAGQQAASAPTDRALIEDRVANHGQVISAQPGVGPARRRWVIVTDEQTTGQDAYRGLPAQLHVTYAITTHTQRGWVISQWAPQT